MSITYDLPRCHMCGTRMATWISYIRDDKHMTLDEECAREYWDEIEAEINALEGEG